MNARLEKYDVVYSNPNPEHRDIHTHTWGETFSQAYARVVEVIEESDGVFEGWEFTITPTGRNY